MKILGVGVPTLDVSYACAQLPGFDESVLAQAIARSGGGQVATALVAASRLGAQTSMLGRVGEDQIADEIRAGLDAEGVSTDLLRIAGTSSSSVVLVGDDGRRAIIYDPGAGECAPLGEPDYAALAQADGVLIERWDELTLAVLESKPPNVLLDLDEWLAWDSYLLGCCTTVIAAGTLAVERPVQAVLDELLSTGVQTAVLTMGRHGSWGKSQREELYHEPIFPVTVVDTTGAGDVYHGAFMVAQLNGLGLTDAMHYAAVVAGLKCEKAGGRAGIPTLGYLYERAPELRR